MAAEPPGTPPRPSARREAQYRGERFAVVQGVHAKSDETLAMDCDQLVEDGLVPPHPTNRTYGRLLAMNGRNGVYRARLVGEMRQILINFRMSLRDGTADALQRGAAALDPTLRGMYYLSSVEHAPASSRIIPFGGARCQYDSDSDEDIMVPLDVHDRWHDGRIPRRLSDEN